MNGKCRFLWFYQRMMYKGKFGYRMFGLHVVLTAVEVIVMYGHSLCGEEGGGGVSGRWMVREG